jgi:cysteinyl-tRNA synthetase
MSDIIKFIESLVDRSFAYASDGDVYFDVGKDSGYGKLSNRTLQSMQGEGGETASRKRHVADFALWKSAKPGEPSWESPWSKGRPGWHIECSAMSRKLLGETFDIHGGGLDLVFPHHENEIAQSECCHGKPMVLYWAHNGLLRRGETAGKIGGRSERADATASSGATGSASADQDSGKMSRSKGAGGLADLITRQGGERIRFFLLRTHYRSTVLFSEEAIAEAGIGLDSFYRLFKRYHRITGQDYYALKAPASRSDGEVKDPNDPTLKAVAAARQKFLTAMDDDFNTGGAVGELFELAKIANKYCDDAQLESTGGKDQAAVAKLREMLTTLKELSGVLGLFLSAPQASGGHDELLDKVMQLVIGLRAESRKNKDFATADAIRDGIAPLGITLEDRAGGTEWSGGSDKTLDGLMQLLIQLRADARKNKNFALGDAIRDRLGEIGVVLEDRPGGTEWSKS